MPYRKSVSQILGQNGQKIKYIQKEVVKMSRMNEKQMISILANSPTTEGLDKFIEKNGIDSVDRDGRSILFSVLQLNDINLVEHLIGRNANINMKDNNGFTPLHFSVMENNEEITRLLIENGAEIDAIDKWGNTPLWRSAMNSDGKTSIAELLIKHGADVKKENFSGVSPEDLF